MTVLLKFECFIKGHTFSDAYLHLCFSMAIRLYEDQTVLIFYTVLPGMNAGPLKCYVMSLYKNRLNDHKPGIRPFWGALNIQIYLYSIVRVLDF